MCKLKPNLSFNFKTLEIHIGKNTEISRSHSLNSLPSRPFPSRKLITSHCNHVFIINDPHRCCCDHTLVIRCYAWKWSHLYHSRLKYRCMWHKRVSTSRSDVTVLARSLLTINLTESELWQHVMHSSILLQPIKWKKIVKMKPTRMINVQTKLNRYLCNIINRITRSMWWFDMYTVK